MGKRILITWLLSAVALCIHAQTEPHASPNSLSAEEKSVGWTLLYDGTSSAGWRGLAREDVPAGWDFSGGVIRTLVEDAPETGSRGDLITKGLYSDFDLVFEWKLLTQGGNSGVKYFVDEAMSGTGTGGLGLEYQILDDKNHPWMLEGRMSPNDYHTLGALYEFFPPSEKKQMEPLGRWNISRIVSKGTHVEHWLNGTKILEYERGGARFLQMKAKSKFRDLERFGLVEKGHILLQDHGGEIQFRNLKIRELSKD